MSEKYIYSVWKDISCNNIKKYIRTCNKKAEDSLNAIGSMNCIIEFKDGVWQAEIPRTLDIPNFAGEKYFFIKDLNYFKDISEAVLWVDIEMSKFDFNVLDKPFIFNWY